CLVQAPNCCFGNPFLGAIRGGTRVCSSLTSWRVRGAGWFCLWALNLVEVRDVGACVVRLWSHMVAPVFSEFLCLSGCVPRVASACVDSAGSAGVVFGLTKSSFASALLEFLLLWLVGTRYRRSSLPDGRGGGLLCRAFPAV
ncbi:hypothetical protein Taro_004122, partial [Colocasia esculenta]|nr:hypothetical protein [Colocasia esculenta]